MERLAAWIDRVITKSTDEAEIAKVAAEVKDVCARFPAPGLRI
jgi:glycine hydroxymethyltransferase